MRRAVRAFARASSVAAPFALAPAARALDPEFSAGLALTIGASEHGVMFGLSLDVRATVTWGEIDQPCSSGRPYGVGPFAQITWLIPDGARLAAGLHGGGVINGARGHDGVDGEAGWTYTLAPEDLVGGHGVQLGFTWQPYPFMDLLVRANGTLAGDGFAWDGMLGLGGRTDGMFGHVICSE